MIALLFKTYLISLLISGLTGIIAIWINKTALLYFKLLPWFVFITLAVEKYAYYYSANMAATTISSMYSR